MKKEHKNYGREYIEIAAKEMLELFTGIKTTRSDCPDLIEVESNDGIEVIECCFLGEQQYYRHLELSDDEMENGTDHTIEKNALLKDIEKYGYYLYNGRIQYPIFGLEPVTPILNALEKKLKKLPLYQRRCKNNSLFIYGPLYPFIDKKIPDLSYYLKTKNQGQFEKIYLYCGDKLFYVFDGENLVKQDADKTKDEIIGIQYNISKRVRGECKPF